MAEKSRSRDIAIRVTDNAFAIGLALAGLLAVLLFWASSFDADQNGEERTAIQASASSPP